MQDWNHLAPTGIVMAAGTAIGWIANWWRQTRKDVYNQVKESTQELIDKQNETIQRSSDRITHLEGRLEQVTEQMSQALMQGAEVQYQLGMALGKLEAANQTIEQQNTIIEGLRAQVSEWERRWDEHFPKESE